MNALDLFCGAGGASTGLTAAGLTVTGVEWDRDAAATHEAAGHATIVGDVGALDPTAFGPIDLLWASPPCQAWSRAGKRRGILDQPRIFALLPTVMAGGRVPADGWRDDRSRLVLEPARWLSVLLPRLVACEQVPDVLPFWQALARELEQLGYSTWCGLLDSERYGVPQTRTRAILLARRDGQPCQPPIPTHTAYDPRLPDKGRYQGTEDLFGEGLLPWVSMADALGFGMTERPALSVTTGTDAGGADPSCVGGSGARTTLRRERDAGRWMQHALRGKGMTDRYGERPDRPVTDPALTVRANGGGHASPGFVIRTGNNSRKRQAREGDVDWRDSHAPMERSVDCPAPTLDTAAGRKWSLRNGNQANACERTADEPSGTLFFGHQLNDVRWRMAGAGATAPDTCGQVPRESDEPSHTLTGKGTAAWVYDRPATSVCSDPRIFPPEYRGGRRAMEAGYGHLERAGEGSIKVTVTEAAVLQGFPPDYPWQGSKTSRFRQIGNAVPPPLAEAIGRALTTTGEAAA